MTELQNDVVTLVDEEGKEHDFMLLDIILVNDSEYAIMIASDAAETVNTEAEEQEAVIFRIDESDNGEQALIVVEDDDEWDAVAAAWEEQVEFDEENDEE